MIKFNRIGNKLGFAGAISILLAVGMVANQMMSEAEVGAANGRFARSQQVIDGTFVGHIELRRTSARERCVAFRKTKGYCDQAQQRRCANSDTR